jgi:hypothetical protein
MSIICDRNVSATSGKFIGIISTGVNMSIEESIREKMNDKKDDKL